MNPRGYNTIKAKKILAVLLATATLLTAMVMPASAAEKNVPFTDVYLGYNVSGYINLTNYTVTAEFSLSRRPGQIVAQVGHLEVYGSVYYFDSKGERMSKSYRKVATTGTLSCRISAETDGLTVSASASYLINDEKIKFLMTD